MNFTPPHGHLHPTGGKGRTIVATNRAKVPMDAACAVLQDSFLASVLGSLADICLEVTPSGTIIQALAKPETMSGQEVQGWAGSELSERVDGASARKLAERLALLAGLASQGEHAPMRWVELVHPGLNGRGMPVRYAMHWISQSGNVLMLGQDQRPIIEIQQQLLNAQIALERDYEAQRAIDTRYRILMDFTSDAVALISLDGGVIADLNHNAAALLGSTRAGLVRSRLADGLEGQTTEGLMAALEAPTAAGSDATVDVVLKATQRKLQLTGKLLRASGERFVMLRLNDPEHRSVGDDRLVSNLRQLFSHGVDAIVFTDRDGNILAASETFLNLTDANEADSVRGRSMADFLGRGAVDLRVLLDNAQRAGQLRMYATRLKTDFGAQVAVEVSATWLNDQLDPVLALVIRNATSASALRVESVGHDPGMQNVIELVGSSTLKDIVSETTEVIEKICIETAIELTRNNRVAAAEMLGLSRQSLYVKLRKYALLSREEG